MELKTLIFSNQLKHRVLRHVFFWVGRFCVLLMASQGFALVQGLKKIIQLDLMYAMISIAPQIPFCYFVLYFLIPFFFLRKKYSTGFAIFICTIFIYWIINYSFLKVAIPYLFAFFGLNTPTTDDTHIFALLRFFDYTGPLASCCLMCSLKFLKFWYITQQENTELTRENGKAELQVLKAQVHPHFLFNTLNNIYSFTLAKSPLASDLLDKLFGILHYMILEGQSTWVPLKKEIKLLEDYISLEMVRYGDRLKMRVNIKGNAENKFIAPLLLIPFLENSFKHGSSKMISHPVVDLSIVIEDDQLIFTLRNNKPDSNTHENKSSGHGGIGLKNTAKRLQLLYPETHKLKIESTDTSFSVYIHIMLKEMKEVELEKPVLPETPKTLSYVSH